jgi:hypothetical protein
VIVYVIGSEASTDCPSIKDEADASELIAKSFRVFIYLEAFPNKI